MCEPLILCYMIRRYQLPVIFIVMNNNGIYRGLDRDSWRSITQDTDQVLGLRSVLNLANCKSVCNNGFFKIYYSIPPTSLLYGIRYDKIASAFGAKGYNAETIQELNHALSESLTHRQQGPVIINIIVNPSSGRKAQVS